LLLFLFLSAFASACGGAKPAEDKRPDITAEKIRDDLNGERVRVPAEDGAAEPSSWRFFLNEPKELEILDTQMDGDRATIVVNLRTGTSPRAEQQGIRKKLAGNIRLYYELHTYVAVRRWEIVRIENLTFAYQKE
jgi:hypothetical protein